MSAFVKAAAYALADQPAVNAGKDITLKDRENSLWFSCGYVFACLVSSQENDLSFSLFITQPQNQDLVIYCLYTALTYLDRPQ